MDLNVITAKEIAALEDSELIERAISSAFRAGIAHHANSENDDAYSAEMDSFQEELQRRFILPEVLR